VKLDLMHNVPGLFQGYVSVVGYFLLVVAHPPLLLLQLEEDSVVSGSEFIF